MDEERQPDVRLDVYFVEYGYQVDIFVDGKQIASQCREFGESYPISMLNKKMIETIKKAISEFRKGM